MHGAKKAKGNEKITQLNCKLKHKAMEKRKLKDNQSEDRSICNNISTKNQSLGTTGLCVDYYHPTAIVVYPEPHNTCPTNSKLVKLSSCLGSRQYTKIVDEQHITILKLKEKTILNDRAFIFTQPNNVNS